MYRTVGCWEGLETGSLFPVKSQTDGECVSERANDGASDRKRN